MDLKLEMKLWDLAEALGNHRQLPALGLQLGFERNTVQRYMQMNRERHDSSGTAEMLFNFRDMTPREQLIPKLVKALQKAKLSDYVNRISQKAGSKQKGKEKHQVKKTKRLKKKGRDISGDDDSSEEWDIEEDRHGEISDSSLDSDDSVEEANIKEDRYEEVSGSSSSSESGRTSKGKQPAKKAKQLKKKGKRTSREVSSEEEEEDQPSMSDKRHARKRRSEGEMSIEPRKKKAKKTGEMASPAGQDFDHILMEVAKRAMQDLQVNDLGKALKIPIYEIEAAQVGNQNGRKYDGTINMLRSWKKKQRKAEARRTLINALEGIEWFEVLGDCIPGWDAGRETEPKGLAASASTRPSQDEIDSRRQYDEKGLGPASALPIDSRGQDSGEGLGSSSASLSDSDQGKRNWAAEGSEKYSRSRIRRKTPEDKDMKYEMLDSGVRGYALIMYNHDIEGIEDKKSWWRTDVGDMKTVLDRLGYTFPIEPHECINCSRQEMLDILREFIEKLNKDKPQSAVVFISSHGDECGVLASDGDYLTIRCLLDMFSDGVLLGKPKVIFIDACWGQRHARQIPVSASGSAQSSSPPMIPENADIFLIHATAVGKYAWNWPDEKNPRKANKGSWFVQDFCDVVYSQERDLEDLDTIMLRVTDRIRNQDKRKAYGQSTTVLKQGVNKKLFF